MTAKDFSGWDDRSRRGFVFFLEWRDYWVKRQGFCGEFRRMDPEEIRKDPQFDKYCEAAEWLTQQGRTVGNRLKGWRMYLAYVCDDLIQKRFRPSPLHLRNKKMFRDFNAGCHIAEEHAPLIGRQSLVEKYRKALHPSLRSSAVLRIMGFDLLHD